MNEKEDKLKATYQKTKLYEPSREEIKQLYGKIEIYSAEKRFASAKCCMCCN